jgi:hypothetical protein
MQWLEKWKERLMDYRREQIQKVQEIQVSNEQVRRLQRETSVEHTQKHDAERDLSFQFSDLFSQIEHEHREVLKLKMTVTEALWSRDMLDLIPAIIEHEERHDRRVLTSRHSHEYSRQDLKDVIEAAKSKDIFELVATYLSAIASVISVLLTWIQMKKKRGKQAKPLGDKQREEPPLLPQPQMVDLYAVLREIKREVTMLVSALESLMESLKGGRSTVPLFEARSNLRASATHLTVMASRRLMDLTGALEALAPDWKTHQLQRLEEVVTQIENFKKAALYLASPGAFEEAELLPDISMMTLREPRFDQVGYLALKAYEYKLALRHH